MSLSLSCSASATSRSVARSPSPRRRDRDAGAPPGWPDKPNDPAVQPRRTLWRDRGAGQLHQTVELAPEPGPELCQTRQLHTQFAVQLLAPASGAVNAIGPDAQVEARDIPSRALPGRRELQLARLAAQLAGKVQLHLGLQRFVAQCATAPERTAELAGQLRQPIRRVQLAQLQVGLPVDAISETDAQAAGSGTRARARSCSCGRCTTSRLPTERVCPG